MDLLHCSSARPRLPPKTSAARRPRDQTPRQRLRCINEDSDRISPQHQHTPHTQASCRATDSACRRNHRFHSFPPPGRRRFPPKRTNQRRCGQKNDSHKQTVHLKRVQWSACVAWRRRQCHVIIAQAVCQDNTKMFLSALYRTRVTHHARSFDPFVVARRGQMYLIEV